MQQQEKDQLNHIFGRDKLIKNELLPLVVKRSPLILSGQRGIGKSLLFKWAFHHLKGTKVFLSAEETLSTCLKKIASSQADSMDIEEPIKGNPHHAVFFAHSMKVDDIKQAIIQGPTLTIFIDDCHKLKPQFISFIRGIHERFPIFFCGDSKLREEMMPLVWGKPKIKVGPLEKKDRMKLAEYIKLDTGSSIEASYIASEGRGVPGRCWSIARGEKLRDSDDRVQGEEINIAPVLLIGVFLMVGIRYIGKGTDQMDLQVIGGFCMVLGLMLRFALSSGMKA